jgi:hypothetical protein
MSSTEDVQMRLEFKASADGGNPVTAVCSAGGPKTPLQRSSSTNDETPRWLRPATRSLFQFALCPQSVFLTGVLIVGAKEGRGSGFGKVQIFGRHFLISFTSAQWAVHNSFSFDIVTESKRGGSRLDATSRLDKLLSVRTRGRRGTFHASSSREDWG